MVYGRPDGHYRVVVMRRTAPGAKMPGQSGDPRGVVRRYDRNGRLVAEAPVEMVQLVQKVEWGDQAVEVPLIVKWSLPD